MISSHSPKMHRRRGLKARWRSKARLEIPVAYSKYLSNTLAERIMELASGSRDEQLDLSEDLALVRLTARDAAVMYDALCQTPVMSAEGRPIEAVLQARLAAGAILREALKEVADMCERYVKVAYAPSRSQISVLNLDMILSQVVTEAYDVLGESPDMIAKVMELSQRVKAIRLPDENIGTTITPDMDVLAMDRTIPASPEDQSLKIA